MRKQLFACLLSLLLLTGFTACKGNTSEPSQNTVTIKKEISLDDKEFISFSGRVYGSNENGYTLSNTASGFEVKTDSTRVTATLNAALLKEAWRGTCYFNVYVDGEFHKTFDLDIERKEFTLFENGDGKSHVISLLKSTEAQYSVMRVYDVAGNGNFYPVDAPSDTQITFFGDSITCGYGNIGPASSMDYFTYEQDGMQTYAYLCAQKLGAEIDVLAASGWAIVKAEWHTSDMRIPRVFDKYSPIDDDMVYLAKPDMQTDYVVVNLGTNDYTYYANHKGELARFTEAYYDFYTELRLMYPFAKIVLAFGMMDWDGLIATMEPCVQQVLSRAQADGDDNISYVRLYTANVNLPEDIGSNGHPTVSAHRKSAEVLYRHIISLA